MTANDRLTPYELNARAVAALLRELGDADTARFIRQVRHGTGDYTTDRIVLQAGLTLDDLFAEVQAMRAAGQLPPMASEPAVAAGS